MSLTTWEEPATVYAAGRRVEVSLPPLEEILDDWPEIAACLKKSTVRTGCFEPIDLLRAAFAGQLGIWVCRVDGEVKAAATTEIRQYPRRRILEVLFLGGSDMKAWLRPLIEAVDAHAKAAGCEMVATTGRKGWARAWGGRLTENAIIVRELR